MVWIYGGGFISGNASYAESGPDYLLDENVVFVSLRYRLGIFGCLSTGDGNALGNWGLKDLIIGLKWVKSNIAKFGGNPEDVTIFGQSAGAAYVSYLLLVEEARGLFQKSILHSGSSLCLWSLHRTARRTAFTVGRSLGIITLSSAVLVNAFRGINYEVLQTASYLASGAIFLEDILMGLPYGVVKEPDVPGAVFVGESHELFSNGDFQRVPTMIGVTSNEYAALGALSEVVHAYLATYDLQPENLAPIDLSENYFTRFLAAQQIRQYYFGFTPIAIASLEQVSKYANDDLFYRSTRQTAKELAKFVATYFYVFAYEGILSGVTNRTVEGVGHTEDLSYIFRRNRPSSPNDRLTRSRMIKLWTDFAKYGNPTRFPIPLLQNVIWPAVVPSSPNLPYLNIDTNLEVLQNPFADRMAFYDLIYSIFGDPPYDTY